MTRRALVGWWGLTMLGCLALVESPRLAWATSPSPNGVFLVTGFNSVSDVAASDIVGTEIGALGLSLPDTSSQVGTQGDGSSDTPSVPPGLNTIPLDLGGTDANARWGIFVLVIGATALFIALWTLWGEAERRRAMARGVFVLGGLALVPLLHDLLKTTAGMSTTSGESIGIGILVGLLGVVVTMVGSTFLYREAGRTP